MTTRILTALQMILAAIVVTLFAGCEEPTPRSEQITPSAPGLKSDEKSKTVEAEKVVPSEVSEPKKVAKPAAKEPEHPYLHIYTEGNSIVIEGALKSRVQIEDIVKNLKVDFPEMEVRNEMKKESHRHAVGWGNRISGAVIGDFIRLIENPVIKYEKGIVTLKGVASNANNLKRVSLQAIDGFTDVWTTDMINELEVAK